MGVHNADHLVKDKGRVSNAVVPQASGDYAEQRITFGAAKAGDLESSFMGVTALIESCPAGASLELWLAQVSDGAVLAGDRTDANYFYSGFSVFTARTAVTGSGTTVSFGSATWPLAGWPAAQLRMRSGGVGGAAQFSGAAF